MAERRLNDNDMNEAATWIVEEARRRKGRRSDVELRWKEIDRQISMEPVRKADPHGRSDPRTGWIPQMELPLQAETLEQETADARRLLFPEDRNFFSARSLMRDETLDAIRTRPVISGLDDTFESFLSAQGLKEIDQDLYDEINAAALRHNHRMYRARDKWDLINAEAFKYGMGVGRQIMVDVRNVFPEESGIHVKAKRIPCLVPRTVKNVYLDDNENAVLNEGIMIEPAVIEWTWVDLPDISRAAKKGSSEFSSERGGWIKRAVTAAEPLSKSDNLVQLVKYEGDLVIPRGAGKNIELFNVILWVMVERGGPRVIRFFEREFPWRSYVFSPYHREGADRAYPNSPLMIGSPIHKAATEAFSALLQVAALNARPPVKYNPSDQYLQAAGGPNIEPGALWESISDVIPAQIGNIGEILQAYVALLTQYENATGTTAPRLGAQTKSHQTAFAVDQEIGRGLVRTLDYVRSTLVGPMTAWLAMEHAMLRRTMRPQPVWLDRFGAFMDIGGQDLADTVVWDVHGASGPLKEREDQARRLQALQLAIQVEIQKVQLAQATGQTPEPLDLNNLQRRILEDGGFADVDQLFATAAGSAGVPFPAAGGRAVSPALQLVAGLPESGASA